MLGEGYDLGDLVKFKHVDTSSIFGECFVSIADECYISYEQRSKRHTWLLIVCNILNYASVNIVVVVGVHYTL